MPKLSSLKLENIIPTPIRETSLPQIVEYLHKLLEHK